ncbi:MAG: phosphatidylinositol dimannoside acyltransferase [Actinomycetota bacterium]|nr:phosphatidylinositol dimannoside acyltransferase [Actinomycetota bacterium]
MGVAQEAALAAYKVGSRVARLLPAPAASLAGRAVGLGLAGTDAGRRHMVERHLQRIHGGTLSPLALRRAVQRAFDSYARYWVESFRLPELSVEQLDAGMSYEGLEHLRAARAAGAGAIMALPHLGGWDFGGAWLATQGYPITVVVEELEPAELFEWFAEFRRTLGMTVVPLGPQAGGAVLKALRANELVGLLCDRDIGGGGIPVEFFGEKTTLPAGPVTIAVRSGTPILPTAVYFDGRGHRGVIRPPLDLTRQGTLREDVARLTQALARELEVLISAAPEQWHVFQPNWPSDPGYGG